jgi:hypothetical protein
MKTKLRSEKNGSKKALPAQSANLPSAAGKAPAGVSQTKAGKSTAGKPRKAGVICRADCNTFAFYTAAENGALERDLDGRLFFVERLKNSGYGVPYRDGARREITYDEALNFIAKYSHWLHPWKFLAHHGIKAPVAPPANKPIRTAAAPGEHGFITEGLVIKILGYDGSEVATTNVDDHESGLLQKAAAAAGLKLEELLGFIIYRQMEAFYPPGVKGIWRVSDEAVEAISVPFAAAARDVDSLWALCSALADRFGSIPDRASPADLSNIVRQMKSLADLIHKQSDSVRVDIIDAHEHWRQSVRPALLEQQVGPVSISSARAAA